ncbi:MAG: hypothetical protein DRJ32_02575 [Thermoprotei archaeon]|nr:MAG: hypothetical protein DRJ32_02575 [Thermoprotei archaeon]
MVESIEYDELSSYILQQQMLEKAKMIFGLAYLGFKLTFNKDPYLCDLFIRIMYEASQLKYRILRAK